MFGSYSEADPSPRHSHHNQHHSLPSSPVFPETTSPIDPRRKSAYANAMPVAASEPDLSVVVGSPSTSNAVVFNTSSNGFVVPNHTNNNRNGVSYTPANATSLIDMTSTSNMKAIIEDTVQGGFYSINFSGSRAFKLKNSFFSEIDLSVCSWVTDLNLSSNELVEVPEQCSKLTNLHRLVLSKNVLTTGPGAWIDDLQSLSELHMRLNKLSSWPSSINKLRHLTFLDLSFNSLKQISFGMIRDVKLKIKKVNNILPQLRYLDISYNDIKIFPRKVLKLKSLTHLDISANSTRTLPADITKLSNLTSIGLKECSLTEFPAALLGVPTLKSINLERNQHIVSLPQNLASLSLIELRIDNCALKDITPLFKIRTLQRLIANKNQIAEFPAPDDSLEMVNLEELRLAHNCITRIGATLFHLPSLVILDLSNNRLEHIHDAIGQCFKLRKLDLENNRLQSLPKFISRLYNLTNLNISMNNISSLSDCSQFSNLVCLKCNSNSFTELPAGLVTASGSLRKLHFDNNKLTRLTDDVYQLTNLQELHLSGNLISSLDENVSKLQQLNSLMLDTNEFETLPLLAITKITGLQKLCISQNSESLRTLPPEVIHWSEQYNVKISNEFETPDLVIDKLYIGSAVSASNRQLLQRLGITHVLITAKELTPPHQESFLYQCISVDDSRSVDLKSHFTTAFDFIDAGRNAGGVIVHCVGGVSRSATIVTAYLMRTEHWPLKAAFQFLKSKRDRVYPNPGFRDQLIQFERELFPDRDSQQPARRVVQL